MGRSRWRPGAAASVVVAALLVVGLAGCGGGAGASDVVAESLSEAGDLVAEGEQYDTAQVAGATYLLNASRGTLSRLGAPGEADERVTVEVGAGGVLDLLTRDEVDALAVLDRREGRLEWFDLETLIRRQVELGRGDWRGALLDEDAAVLVNRTTGELVKANRSGVVATAPVGGRGDELEVSVTSEGVLVRNLTTRTESLRRADDLREIRAGDLPGSPDDRLLTGVGPTAPANWLLNLSTGELHGLGVDGGWAGTVKVAAPDTDARAPLAVGDWVYVLLPSSGSVLVVEASDGRGAGRVELGRRPALTLTPHGQVVVVASVPTGYSATLEGTKLQVVRDGSPDVSVLADRVTAGPGGGPTGPSGGGLGNTSGTGGGATTTRTGTPPPPGRPSTTGTSTSTPPRSTPPPPTGGTTRPPADYTIGNVRTGAVGQDFIDVSWQLDDPDGRVEQVTVNWGTGGRFVDRVVLAPASGSHRITGLAAATAYTIDVAADARDDTHKLGNQVRATTAAAPTPPPPVPPPVGVAATPASPTALDVSWSLDDPAGVVRAITVNWGTGGTFGGRVTLGPGARAHRIEGLAPATTYAVDVVAIGHDESSKVGNTASAATPAEPAPPPPPPPATVTATHLVAAGPTFLDLAWDIDDPAGRAQSVTVNVGTAGAYVGRLQLGGGARSARFDGLTPGTTYDVNVVAIVSNDEYHVGATLTAATA